MQHLDDAQLMQRVQAADTQAFAALYDRFCGPAYRAARRLAQDEKRAQDIVVDAFAAVWRARSSYTPERGPVRTWILDTVACEARTS